MRKSKKNVPQEQELPEVGRRVVIHFRDTVYGVVISREGIFDGEKWMIAETYGLNVYRVPPPTLEFVKWEDLNVR